MNFKEGFNLAAYWEQRGGLIFNFETMFWVVWFLILLLLENGSASFKQYFSVKFPRVSWLKPGPFFFLISIFK